MKALQFGLLMAALFVAESAQAGTGRQTTTFLVEADERAVCRWIEQNSNAIDESTGAEVLAVRGRQSKLRKQTKEGTFTIIVDHGPLDERRGTRGEGRVNGVESDSDENSPDRHGPDHHEPPHHGQFRTVLLKSDNPDLVSQETEIQVEREGGGSRVTITVVATVSSHGAMAISLGIRPSLRGMRKLLEGRFGSPNEP
jgi:hypothetical protein